MNRNPAVLAMDLGTNTFRWLWRDKSAASVRRGREVIGLGRGLAENGQINESEIAVAEQVLNEWRPGNRVIPPAQLVLAAGTHALRVAANRSAVTERLGRALGSPISIIEPEREASLTFRGAATSVQPGVQRWAVLDIGGGSTELAAGTGQECDFRISIPIGVVTHSAESDEPLSASVARVGEVVERALDDVYNVSPSGMFENLQLERLASNCGTSSALALRNSGQEEYHREALDGARIGVAWLVDFVAEHGGRPATGWDDVPGVGRSRGQLIGPGIGILLTMLQAAGVGSWTNTESGLLEGLADELLDSLPDNQTGKAP